MLLLMTHGKTIVLFHSRQLILAHRELHVGPTQLVDVDVQQNELVTSCSE